MNLKNLILITLVIALFGVSIALANQENIITIKLFTVNTSNNPDKINETLILKEGQNINLKQDTLNKTITINANISNTQTNRFDTIYVNKINTNGSYDLEIPFSLINNTGRFSFYTEKDFSYVKLSLNVNENYEIPQIQFYLYNNKNGKSNYIIIYDDRVKIGSLYNLTGGNAYVCTNKYGEIYRSASPCT